MITRNIFYLLTAASGFLEVGLIAAALAGNPSLTAAAVLLTAFHAGYLVNDLQSLLGWKSERFWGYGGFAGSVLLPFAAHPDLWGLAAVGTFLCASALQSVRFLYKTQGDYTGDGKALFRFIGYISGGLAAFYNGLPLLILAVPAMLIIRSGKSDSRPRWKDRFETKGHAGLLGFIFFHHVQYFLVVYGFLMTAAQTFGVSPFLVGGMMLLGWAGYSLVECSVKQYSDRVVSLSHILNGLIIAVMAWAVGHSWLETAVAAWVLTGLFGGTAYTAEHIPNIDKHRTKGSRNIAEHLGHAGGVSAAGLMVYFGCRIEAVLIVGAVCSAIAGLIPIPKSHEPRPAERRISA